MKKHTFKVGFDVWLLLVVLVRASEISAQGTDRCILNFTQQPVLMVDCNVYESDLETLTCKVESIDTAEVPDVQDLSIKWFFFNDTEYDLTIGTNPAERTGGNGGHLTVTSTLHISGTSRPNASFVSEGFYYCRVHMFDASVVLHESQRFKVLHREEYLQQATSCNERTFSAPLESCAVSRLSVDESTTTSSLPDSTATTKTPNEENTTTTDEEPTLPSSSTVDTGSRGSGGTLEVWIYVLVAVAAVFAMIIVILAIMCVGLCLRRSQTMDANSLKQKENGGMPGHFISHSSSMVNNEMYHGGVGIDDTDLTTGTHFTSHSQISDDNYNILGEREYEVIVSRPFDDDKQEYHRLQRPSPPAVPTGRNGMFGFSPPSGEFRSMSTLTSQMNGMDSLCEKESNFTKDGYSTLPSRPPPPPYNGDMHVYRELENPATTMPVGRLPSCGGMINSPTNSSPPDSARYFERGDSTTQLLPPLPPARGTGLRKASSASNDSSLNESLYSSAQQPHPLEKIPETGTIFADPPNPTAFPVNDYDYIPGMTDYEKPVASKKQKAVGENPKTRVSTKSMNYETDPNLERRASDTANCLTGSTDVARDSIIGFKLPLSNDDDDSTDVTGASDMHFPIGLKQGSATISSEQLSTVEFAGGSSTGGHRSSVRSADFTEPTAVYLPTSNSTMKNVLSEPKVNLQMNGVSHPDNSQSRERRSVSRERRSISQERRSMSREAPSPALINGENTIQYSSDIAVPLHIVAEAGSPSNKLHTPSPPPQNRPNPYKELDTSSLKQHLNFTKLQVEAGTVV